MKRNLIYIFGIILLYGCGLKYESPETMRDKQKNQKDVVREYLNQQITNDSIKYESISFGNPIVVKPYSYQQLDSLYDRKYKLEQVGKFDPELEERIELQKRIIESDTNKIRYLLPHIFAIKDSLQSEINFTDVYLSEDDTVIGVTFTDHFMLDNESKTNYLFYLKNESFLMPGYNASNEEQKLYDLFRAKEEMVEGADRTKLLNQLSEVMKIGRKMRTANASVLAKATVINALENRKYNPISDKFNAVDGIFEENILQEYIIVYAPPSQPTVEVRLTPYFEVISIQ